MANNGTDIIAINSAEIDKHMLSIIDCSNKVKAIFNKIDDQIALLKTYYSCSGASALYKQYEEFNENYAIIVDNLLSYNSDLMSLKKKYGSTFGDLAQKIKSEAAKISVANVDKYKEKR